MKPDNNMCCTTLADGRLVVRRQKKGLASRFWSKVDRRGASECWPWTGGRKNNGYGQISADPREGEYVGRKLSAHRLAYELAFGPIPNGLHVLHRCDNRACVNPSHFFLGTHQDNMADMLAKGRHAHGDSQPTRKLSRHQVRAIRWLAIHDPGPHVELAREFAVSESNVKQILTRATWRLAR
jgi:hypothetical protein